MAKIKPEDYTPEQKEIASDLKVASALDALAISEGGKLLSSGLVTDIVSALDTLCAKYKELTMQEFVGLCADMKSKLDLYRAIKRAPKRRADLQDIFKESLGE